ncbi:MAG: hypothetical protein MZV63_64455 [Marinilabiliales bacterium]|nr:hypothetical protein [Marinilabiliales bacterium]
MKRAQAWVKGKMERARARERRHRAVHGLRRHLGQRILLAAHAGARLPADDGLPAGPHAGHAGQGRLPGGHRRPPDEGGPGQIQGQAEGAGRPRHAARGHQTWPRWPRASPRLTDEDLEQLEQNVIRRRRPRPTPAAAEPGPAQGRREDRLLQGRGGRRRPPVREAAGPARSRGFARPATKRATSGRARRAWPPCRSSPSRPSTTTGCTGSSSAGSRSRSRSRSATGSARRSRRPPTSSARSRAPTSRTRSSCSAPTSTRWHASPNASDNAAGCAVALEAARILKAVGAEAAPDHPRRPLGRRGAGPLRLARAYVRKHFGDPKDPKNAADAGLREVLGLLQPGLRRRPVPRASTCRGTSTPGACSPPGWSRSATSG